MKKINILILFLLLSNLCIALNGAKYLIIAPDSTYYYAVRPLAQWKQKKGMPTKIVTLGEIGVTGTNISGIKSYIVNACTSHLWNSHPEFVLLVGSTSYISSNGSNSYDDYYADINGDDKMEIAVGRIPAASVLTCSTAVAKILYYERTPYVTDPNWFTKGLGMVNEDGASQPDTVYWNDVRFIYGLWRNYGGYTHIDSFSRLRGNTATDVYNAINDGRAYIIYRGEAVQHWGTLSGDPFTIVPNNCTNGQKLPVVISATCQTLSLSSENYQCDEFLFAGSRQNPKGGASACGTTVVASGSGLGRCRGLVGDGIYQAIFRENIYQLGNALKRGKFFADSVHPTNWNSTRYHEWNMVGDPELNCWTTTPVQLTVTHDTLIYTGGQTYTVTVTKNTSPLAGALVCVMMDTTVYQYNTTNSSGQVSFSITPPMGTMSVTVTAHNYIPYEKNVIVQPGGLAHDVSVAAIYEPIGIIALGTSVYPKAKVKNYGSNTETFPVTFSIGSVYTQTVTVNSLAAGDTYRITFPLWTSVQGSYQTKAYTSLTSDQWRGNDTAYSTISVVVPNDVGVDAILKPDSSLSTNTVVIPQARIKNFGSSTQYSFPVTCSIVGATGALRYANTQAVSLLSANDTVRVNFSSWTPTISELCIVKIRTNLIGDQNSVNDQKTKTIRITMTFFAEGFNDATFPPTGWQSVIVQGSYNWTRTTSNTSPTCSPYEGDAMASYPSYSATSGSTARLISPPVILGSTPVPCTLKFYMYHDNGYAPGSGYGPDSVKVEYSINDTTFNRVTAFRRYEATNGWVEHTVYLGSFSGTLYIGLLAFSEYGDNMNIDYVRLIGSQTTINDVGVDAIIYPTILHQVNSPMVPVARVKNYGNTIQSNFPVVCSIVGNGSIFRYTNTQNVTTLNAGETTRVNFVTWTPNIVEMCTVKMRTSLVGDQNLVNDAKTTTTQINPTINIISPNGAECWGGSSNQIVKWRTIGTGFAMYRLLLSRNSGVTYTDTIVNNVTPTETTYNWAVPLINYTTCRVIIQVLDGGGTIIVQDASDTDFIIDSQTPSVPTLILPASGFYTHDSLPRFWWHRSTDSLSGINNYQLQYATNSGFVGGITINISDTTYQVPTRLADTTYYWRVKAVDRAGNQGNWSLTWSFEIDTRTPQGLGLVSPINGIWLTNTLVIFNWSQVTFDAKSPVRYLLQIDTAVNFTNSILDSTSLTYDTLVLNQTRYYWRVCAFDLAGNQGTFSGRDSFGIDLTAPSVPNLVSPNNGSITNNPNVTFIWKRSTDNISGIDRYTLEYAKNSGFVNPKDTIVTDTIITVTLTDTTFHWRVKSQDRAGNQSSWSASRSFEIDTRIPNAPTLASPINGTWLTNTTVIFNWSIVSFDAKSPLRYILQVDTLTTFATPRIDTTSLVSDTLTLTQARHFWRVRAYDLAGNQGAFSGRDSFGLDCSAPSIPNLMNPTSGAILNDSFVRFTWIRSTDNLSGVKNYQIQIAYNSNFTNPFDTIVADTTTVRKLRDSTYYWRARVIDWANNQSGYSPTRSFEVDTRIPNAPILVSPINGMWLTTTSVVLNWSSVTNDTKSPVRYILQVAIDTAFTNSITDTTSYVYDTLTLIQSHCYWRVRVYDLAGNQGSFSSPDSFGVDVTAPNVPNLISPTNGAMINNPSVTFIWNRATDNLSGVLRYNLQYARNSGFVNPIDTIVSDTSFTLTLTDTTYYWHIKAQDRAGNQSGWSVSRSLELDTRVPNAPVLVSPINGQWFVNTSLIFNWSAVAFDAKSPVRYVLQIDTSGNFTYPIVDTTALFCDTIVLNQARYFWKVKAYDLAGNQSIFSGRDSFGIDYIAPSIPNLISPVNGAVLTDSFVTFVWNRSSDNLSGVRNYRIQIANNSIFVNPIDTLMSDSAIIRKLHDTTYFWRVKSIDRANNEGNWSNPNNFRVMTTSISENYEYHITHITALNALEPNPATNGMSHISFSLAERLQVILQICDIYGKVVKTLVNADLPQGVYNYIWTGYDTNNRPVAKGVYFVNLGIPAQCFSRKIILVR